MAPHSSTLAWKIPWTEELGGIQSLGLHRVGHDLALLYHFLSIYTHICIILAPHSSTLAWKIPWMEEPGRLQSIGSLRVRYN